MRNETKNPTQNQNQNKPMNKKNKNFVLQELENTEKLISDSEIIARKIINLLITKTINKSRINDLEKFAPKYTVLKILQMTTLYGQMATLQPEIDTDGLKSAAEKESEFCLAEISPPKIDSLCANKTKIIKATEKDFLNDYILNNENLQNEVDKFQPIIDKDQERELKNIEKELKKKQAENKNNKMRNKMSLIGSKKSLNKKLETINEKLFKELKAQLMPKNSNNSINKSLFSEVFNSLSNRSLENNINNFNFNNHNNNNNFFNNQTFDDKISLNNTNNSLNKSGSGFYNKISTLISKKFSIGHKFDLTEDFFEQFPLDYESSEENANEENEEILLRENALRMIFREKEMERSKKNLEEKKAEKIIKEETKKRKDLLEEMAKRPFCFDVDGKVVNVVAPNQERLIGLTKVEAKIKKDICYDEMGEKCYDAHLLQDCILYETEKFGEEIEDEEIRSNQKGARKFGNKEKASDTAKNEKNGKVKNGSPNNKNIELINANKAAKNGVVANKDNQKENLVKRNQQILKGKIANEKSRGNEYGVLVTTSNKNFPTGSAEAKYVLSNNSIINNNNNVKRQISPGASARNVVSKAKKLKENLHSNKPNNNNILEEIKEDEDNFNNESFLRSQITEQNSNTDFNPNYKIKNVNGIINPLSIQNTKTAIDKNTNSNRTSKGTEHLKKHTDQEKLISEALSENNFNRKIQENADLESEAQHHSDNPRLNNSQNSHSSQGSVDSAEAQRRAKIKFYQQNPLRTHEIPPGVSMEIYGVRKDGGPYASIPNKLTFKEFNDLLCIYKPDFAKKKTKPSMKELYAIYETNLNMMSDSKVENSHLKSRTLKNHFSQLNSKVEEDLILKCADLQEQLFVYEEELNNIRSSQKENSETFKNAKADNPLFNIHRSPKLISNKVAHSNNKAEIKLSNLNKRANLVRAFKDFDYNLLDEIDNEKVYDFKNMNFNNNLSDFSKSFGGKKNNDLLRNEVVSPVNKHVPYEKELGPMKKYPRERLSKEILAITGKISVENFAAGTAKNFYTNSHINKNELRKSVMNGSQVGTGFGLNVNFNDNNINNGKNNLEFNNRKSGDFNIPGNLESNRKGNVTTSNFYKTAAKNRK